MTSLSPDQKNTVTELLVELDSFPLYPTNEWYMKHKTQPHHVKEYFKSKLNDSRRNKFKDGIIQMNLAMWR